LCFGVYAQDADRPSQFGFARVVTDYATFAYLADVFILPDYQGQGLGKWLVETMLNHQELQAVKRWTLYTSDAHELYRSFGFDAERDPERYMSYYCSPDLTDH
jgi:GNAT superfamily N-acetyltransferase